MRFLKCSKCGCLNILKTEFLVFCSGCNKALDNNFPDWKKKNPDKSFDDFTKLVCVTGEETQNNSGSKTKNPKGLKYWVGFTIAFAIFYAAGQLGGENIVKFFKSEKTSPEVLEQKWTKETYGDHGLTVETPVKLIKSELALPDNLKQLIEKMDVYEFQSDNGFKVMVNSIQYIPAVGTLNLQGAANGAVNEIKTKKGVTDFTYTEENIIKNDIPGFIQKGTYKQDGENVEFINTGFATGLSFMQVLVLYKADDEVGRIASKKVIESIEIKENLQNN